MFSSVPPCTHLTEPLSLPSTSFPIQKTVIDYADNYMTGLGKTTENFSQNKRVPGRTKILGSAGYTAGLPPTQPRDSVTIQPSVKPKISMLLAET